MKRSADDLAVEDNNSGAKKPRLGLDAKPVTAIQFLADPTDSHYISFSDDAGTSVFNFECKSQPCVCATNGTLLKSDQPVLRHCGEGLCRFEAEMPPLWPVWARVTATVGEQCGLPLPLAALIVDMAMEYGLTWNEFRDLLRQWYTSPLTKEQIADVESVIDPLCEDCHCIDENRPVTLPHLVGTGTSLYGLAVTRKGFSFHSQD